MKYLSNCSGVEAATLAWKGLGWKALAFSEIEEFPSAVLAYHYPDVPNLGDMTQYEGWSETINFADADVYVAGTPCQSFSVAGLRKSLDDERGNLTLTYVKIVDKIDEERNLAGRPPVIFVWENVPGCLNTKDNAFGCFLGGLAGSGGALEPSNPEGRWPDAGYVRGPKRAIAWRVLNAQYFGVPQRRRRVFVIGCAGDKFDPAKALFELEMLPGDLEPGGEQGQGSTTDAQVSTDQNSKPILIDRAAFNQGANAQYNPKIEETETCDALVARGPHAVAVHCMATGQGGSEILEDTCPTLTCNHEAPITFQRTTPTLTSNGDAHSGFRGTDGLVCVHGTQDPCISTKTAHALGRNHGGENVIAYPIQDQATRHAGNNGKGKGNGLGIGDNGEPCPTLTAGDKHAVAFAQNQRDEVREMDVAGALAADSGVKQQTYIHENMQVRRLTPRECERLQGMPDDYTLIPTWKRRAHSRKDIEETIIYLMQAGYTEDEANDLAWHPDGPRYKACGNSMARPVMEWLGKRIKAVLEGIL